MVLRFLRSLINRILDRLTDLILLKSGNKSHLEIERKFSLQGISLENVLQALQGLRFEYFESVEMTDWFLSVSKDDEMRRVRKERVGGSTRYVLTVKHWVDIGSSDREREELEIGISVFVAFLLRAAAFVGDGALAPSFSKVRKVYRGLVEDRQITIGLDDVRGLGQYSGKYLEIECLLPNHDNPSVVAKLIYELALQIVPQAQEIRRSYRQLLIASCTEPRPHFANAADPPA